MFETLEEAQAEILRLNDALTAATNERDAHAQTIAAQAEELESVRKLNQSYFNKLVAQNPRQEDEKKDEDEEVLSCEDFAKTLADII